MELTCGASCAFVVGRMKAANEGSWLLALSSWRSYLLLTAKS